jgi:hypothetical protein
MQLKRMLDLSHLSKVSRVRNPQTLHPIRMSPLLEVLLKSTTSPVARPTANLALEFFVQPMQFI